MSEVSPKRMLISFALWYVYIVVLKALEMR